jgi:hypothetical protein
LRDERSRHAGATDLCTPLAQPSIDYIKPLLPEGCDARGSIVCSVREDDRASDSTDRSCAMRACSRCSSSSLSPSLPLSVSISCNDRNPSSESRPSHTCWPGELSSASSIKWQTCLMSSAAAWGDPSNGNAETNHHPRLVPPHRWPWAASTA